MTVDTQAGDGEGRRTQECPICREEGRQDMRVCVHCMKTMCCRCVKGVQVSARTSFRSPKCPFCCKPLDVKAVAATTATATASRFSNVSGAAKCVPCA